MDERQRAPVLHPRAGEAWFRALPHERRARMNREWRAGLAHDRDLEHGVHERHWTCAWKQGVVFALCDGFCPGSGAWTMLVAFVAGAVLGASLQTLRGARLLSAVLGGAGFFLFELVSRGGIGVGHFFWIVPAAYFSSYLGIAREEQ